MTSKFHTRIVKLMSNVVPGGQQGEYVRYHLGNPVLFSNEKIKRDLHLSFTDPMKALRDTVEDLAKWGHINAHVFESSRTSRP
jgi:hypothetical protein